MAVAVSTRSYDNARSGANTQEGKLTADTVLTHGVSRLFSLPLPGDTRGAEAQPLVVPGVKLADGTVHEVIYVATMANTVFAFDAENGRQLWSRNLGTPVTGSKSIDFWGINDHWGVLSTPVIDVEGQTMYVVAWISQGATVQKAAHFLCALKLSDGTQAHAPLNLEGAVFDPGHGLPAVKFVSAARKQRTSLLLTTVGGVKTVFIAFGSLQETSTTSQGWVIACSAEPFAIAAAWASTVKFHGAGIWQAGAGLAADPEGFVYLMTGNGGFDAVTDWGESFVKLKFVPPAGADKGSLSVVDWWTPFSDDGRTGLDPDAEADAEPKATNFRAYVRQANAAGRAHPDWVDMDLGSGGPVLIPALGLVVGAGKDGVLYVLDQHAMGKTQPGALDHPAANYALLKSPPIFFTYFPPQLNPAPDNIATLNVLFADRTHHLHGNPLYWDSPDLGPVLYCWGENGNLRAWSVHPDGKVTYLACSAEQASAESPVPPGGMPGGMLTLSANGNTAHTGIVWALVPYFDANSTVSPGRLIAYDATRFGAFADGSGRIRKIWDSQDWNIAFKFNKFNVPVVANGRVLVPTYEGTVDVYG